MGIFFEMCELVNRTSKPLVVRFDGQNMVLDPNYTPEGEFIESVHNHVPKMTVAHAKSQNLLMGSEDTEDPTVYEVLVGVKAGKGEKQLDDISFCEQSEEPTRVPVQDYVDERFGPDFKVVPAKRKVVRARHEDKVLLPGAPFDVVARG